MKKIYTLTLCLIGLASSAWAQSPSNLTPESSWSLIKEEAGVKVYFQHLSCNESNLLIWKIENNSSETKTISLHTPSGVQGIKPENGVCSFSFEPKTQKEGACNATEIVSKGLTFESTTNQAIDPSSTLIIIK